MRQPKAPAAARVQASVALLDRGWGKPKQTVGGDLGNPLCYDDQRNQAHYCSPHEGKRKLKERRPG
jgi:hypothetical protein